ncbi:MAG TPA: ATP-dependent protease [Candidatus Thioglobus sp.]|jgi:magnesium chelatase family protein|nr:ATP-dependent protease [Candidatus Thioglobus sp.]HIL21494.1 ATP-dependent protease [Candidatus Thioglobus sp.]
MNQLAKIFTRAADGLDAPLVSIEVHISGGLPCFSIVGLPEGAVKESKDRVRSALMNSKYRFPTQRITVSLAPANLPKSGGRYDLGIALGLLMASGQLKSVKDINEFEFYGELGLDGAVRGTEGLLTALVQGFSSEHHLVIPETNIDESTLVNEASIYPCNHLLQICGFLSGAGEMKKLQIKEVSSNHTNFDFSQVKGQHQAKRAMEVAASGGHNLLLIGPPGAGKTMLSERLPSILPPLTKEQALERASIYSVAGQSVNVSELRIPPFRSPHHTCSAVALAGGGAIPKPGEISLAHEGVLFLDELPEFPRAALEVLRQPMENGVVHLSRAAKQVSFPANFQLIAAMNPCPCGYFGDGSQKCHCTEDQVSKYRSKISGPLLDRIDMVLELPPLPKELLLPSESGETLENSESIRARVLSAYNTQLERQGKANDRLLSDEVDKLLQLDSDDRRLLEMMIEKLSLSARAYYRTIKVARTIADLDKSAKIQRAHLIEAVGYHRFNY